jgi:catechol 2,3-dioxygenase-like lactoylglutathione lyase family enzyme
MGTRIGQWTLDVRDVELMARFWSEALGYRLGDDGQHLWPPADAGPLALSVWLQPVDEPTPGKNRGHPDLVPDGGDADTEVERLLALGARRADIGQTGTEGFVVLADPEGNEFCVLRRAPDEVPDPDE